MPATNQYICKHCGKANEATDTEAYSDECREIFAYLNMKLHRAFRGLKSDRKHVTARLREGFTVEDFKTVIDKKVSTWTGTDWEKYLRPSTLFGTKFEGYLFEAQLQSKPKEVVNGKQPNSFSGKDYRSGTF